MIITVVRIKETKEPVLAMAESVTMGELYWYIDEITDPYACEYKDTEIETRMAITFGVDNEIGISQATAQDVDLEMEDDDGWSDFPDITLDEMQTDETGTLESGDIF